MWLTLISTRLYVIRYKRRRLVWSLHVILPACYIMNFSIARSTCPSRLFIDLFTTISSSYGKLHNIMHLRCVLSSQELEVRSLIWNAFHTNQSSVSKFLVYKVLREELIQWDVPSRWRSLQDIIQTPTLQTNMYWNNLCTLDLSTGRGLLHDVKCTLMSAPVSLN